jgi:hypothetical protein
MPPPKDIHPPSGVPSPVPANPPPVIVVSSALEGGAPPPLVAQPALKGGAMRQILALLLSLCLGLFLADGFVSLLDDSLILLFGTHLLTTIRGLVWLLAMLVAVVVYGLMGLTPMIPKRVFLPITLFNPLAALVPIPLAIYFYSRFEQVAWVVSLCQVIFGLGVLCWLQGGLKLRWPLVAESWLGERRFGWRNLAGFVVVNVFVVLPVVIAYLAVCAAVAVGHFSEGFLALRPGGFTVQVRKYVRNDGRTIQLVPMAHIGEADFYRKLSQSFPTNAVVLMEGVTDDRNLLTNRITYKRMATSLGLAEQHEAFHPVRSKLVRADVDVEQFTTNTIGFLNLVMFIHAKGLNAETVLMALQYSPPPHFEQQLFADLLGKRNQHLLQEIRARLLDSEQLIVPWGVAHMPGIAAEIQASGFHLAETQEYTVIRFRAARNPGGSVSRAGAEGRSK